LLRAVEMRLAADVRVGALLSGGIDSSLVCWAVARLGGDITAFTVGTPGDVWDETANASATADELHIRHRILEQRPENSPDVADLVAAYGEPFACASALGMLSISQVVKREATVLLTGDGGDDVFLGYPRHAHFALAQRIGSSMPRAAANAWNSMRGSVPKRGMLRRAAHLLDYASGGLAAVANAHDGLPSYRQMGMLGERLEYASIEARLLPWSPEGGRRVLDDFIEYERRTRFTGEYLTKVDGGTMYHALEARSPFLDQDVWNFASALPYSLRLRGGRLKAILREIARRRIGERVASGEKRGFGIPVQRWITGRWRAAVQETFAQSLLARDGWIRADAVLAQLRALRDGDTAPQQLWYLYVLEAWMQKRLAQSAALDTVYS
jgi:asparagine synthase (glutamine-hydrolysing)